MTPPLHHHYNNQDISRGPNALTPQSARDEERPGGKSIGHLVATSVVVAVIIIGLVFVAQ
jgi:hypothetical protein